MDGQRIVGAGRLDRLVELDVGKLGPADDALLRLGWKRVPCAEVVQIFLHDHVAAAGEGGILRADDGGFGHFAAAWILRAVDEPEQVAVVEIAKAVRPHRPP